MKKTVEMNYINTYVLGHGICAVGVTKDEKSSHGVRWGVVVSRLDKPLPIGDHIKKTSGAKEFDPAIVISDNKEGIRVLLRAAMKVYAELGGDDPIEVWEDSKRFFAEAAEIEK